MKYIYKGIFDYEKSRSNIYVGTFVKDLYSVCVGSCFLYRWMFKQYTLDQFADFMLEMKMRSHDLFLEILKKENISLQQAAYANGKIFLMHTSPDYSNFIRNLEKHKPNSPIEIYSRVKDKEWFQVNINEKFKHQKVCTDKYDFCCALDYKVCDFPRFLEVLLAKMETKANFKLKCNAIIKEY